MRVKLTITAGPERGRVFHFDNPGTFICGRAKDAFVSLGRDGELSRHHFELHLGPDKCRLKDLGSLNGVIVNDTHYGGVAPLEGMQAPGDLREVDLSNDDEITAGKTRIKVSLDASAMPDDAVKPAADAIADPASAADAHAIAAKTMPSIKASTPEPHPEIEGYSIEEVLGRGSIASTFKARNRKNGRLVVVKTIHPALATNEKFMHALKHEAAISRELRHPNLVQVFDQGRSGDTEFIVLEYVDGMDLLKFMNLTGGRLTVKAALPLMLSALEGVAFVHTASIKPQVSGAEPGRPLSGFVHRGLKPENILLARGQTGWTAKVTDLGMSACFESAEQACSAMAGHGNVLSFWPREQLLNYPYRTPASDVFAIAAAFYFALTGARVRQGLKEFESHCKLSGLPVSLKDARELFCSNATVPIRQRDPTIPQALAEVFDHALRETAANECEAADEAVLSKKLSQLRYPNARFFRAALCDALKQCGLNA